MKQDTRSTTSILISCFLSLVSYFLFLADQAIEVGTYRYVFKKHRF